MLLKSDGSGELRALTDDAYKDRGPRWSPDGRRIAFYSNRSGAWEIWTIASDGGDKRRLTFTEGANVYFPIWSPSGDRLVYTRHGGLPFVINDLTTSRWLDCTLSHPIASSRLMCREPRWPGSTTIAAFSFARMRRSFWSTARQKNIMKRSILFHTRFFSSFSPATTTGSITAWSKPKPTSGCFP
jgi:dipeptidyl aminopeptidase/acylaminoacyl peptidase